MSIGASCGEQVRRSGAGLSHHGLLCLQPWRLNTLNLFWKNPGLNWEAAQATRDMKNNSGDKHG